MERMNALLLDDFRIAIRRLRKGPGRRSLRWPPALAAARQDLVRSLREE
jgi:hypothetical protein